MSPATPPAILFDMDGVVLEGRGIPKSVHSVALENALTTYELEPSPEQRAALDTYEYTDEFAAAAEELGLDPEEFYDVREQFSADHAVERLAEGSREPFPDADALHDLAAEYELGLVSNSYHDVVAFVVDHYDLAPAFSAVRGRAPGVEGFRRRKPDPHYLQLTLEAMDVEDGVYVGDRESDVIAGRRAGLDPVFVRREHNADAEFEVEPPIAEIESLHELRGVLEAAGEA